MAYGTGVRLKTLPIFADLDGDYAEALANRCQWLRFSKGRQIVGQQDTTTDVFFVVEGTVHAIGYSGTGKAVSYGDIDAGGVFGEFSAVDSLPRSATVGARSDCLLVRMTSSVFREVLSEHPRVALHVLESVIAKTRLLNERVFEFSTLPVDSRLHAELLRMSDLLDGEATCATIDPAPTHQEIATRISTHREAVTRELNRLAADGVLALGRRRIEVRDGDHLRELLERARLF